MGANMLRIPEGSTVKDHIEFLWLTIRHATMPMGWHTYYSSVPRYVKLSAFK